jgi:hypothetical protein
MPRDAGMAILTAMERERLRCPFCTDVIGVYEPAIVLGEDSCETSIAREPSLRTSGDVILHRSYALDLERASHTFPAA